MSLKTLISPPLEAGPSVLDAHHLPAHLDSALEFTARRLARKALAIDLVVIRREYQLPTAAVRGDALVSPPASVVDVAVNDDEEGDEKDQQDVVVALCSKPLPPLPPLTPPPSRSRFTTAIKSLVRSGTLPGLISPPPTTSTFASAGSPGFSSSSSSSPSPSSSSAVSSATGSSIFSPLLAAFSAAASSSSLSMPSTPATPLTPALTMDSSCVSTPTAATMSTQAVPGRLDHSSPQPQPQQQQRRRLSLSSDAFGLRLVHADGLPAKHERVLRQTLDKAARKYRLGPSWLAPSTAASRLGLPAGVVATSSEQNEVLFAAPGLTLRALDHLYTFKTALSSYACTGAAFRLEDAVDELRRYVLARGGRPLAKRELLRRYPALWFGEGHLADVRRMYSRAYGGPEGDCGIAVDGLSACPPGEAGSGDENNSQTTPVATAWSVIEPLSESLSESLLSSQPSSPPSPSSSLSSSLVVGMTAQQRRRRRRQRPLLSPHGDAPEPERDKQQEDGPSHDEAEEMPASPTQRGPALKLQTSFAAAGLPLKRPQPRPGEDDDLTARPASCVRAGGGSGGGGVWWRGMSIGEMLLQDERPATASRLERDELAPATPNAYDDISPITRSEWGFLMGGQAGRQVTVTTF